MHTQRYICNGQNIVSTTLSLLQIIKCCSASADEGKAEMNAVDEDAIAANGNTMSCETTSWQLNMTWHEKWKWVYWAVHTAQFLHHFDQNFKHLTHLQNVHRKRKTLNESMILCTQTHWACLHLWLREHHTGTAHAHTLTQLPANEWMMMRWHTWSQTVRCSEKWMGWREWRTRCKSAGATGRLTSSWSCSQSLCWRQEACHCKMSLHPQALLHSHLEAFAWKYRRKPLGKYPP